jgi:hypothetical protein
VKKVIPALLALSIGAALVACGPEADRARGGGAGADPGNHSALPSPVASHTGVNPIYPIKTAQPVPTAPR